MSGTEIIALQNALSPRQQASFQGNSHILPAKLWKMGQAPRPHPPPRLIWGLSAGYYCANMPSDACELSSLRTVPATDRPGTGRNSAIFEITGLAPGRLCAYWSISSDTWEAATGGAGDGRPALLLYSLVPGVSRPHGMVLFIDTREGMRRLDTRDGRFVAELGRLDGMGAWVRWAASGPVAVPAAKAQNGHEVRLIDIRQAPSPEAPQDCRHVLRFLDSFRRNRFRRTTRVRIWKGSANARWMDLSGSAESCVDSPTPAGMASGSAWPGADAGWPIALCQIADGSA